MQFWGKVCACVCVLELLKRGRGNTSALGWRWALHKSIWVTMMSLGAGRLPSYTRRRKAGRVEANGVGG